jgi:hypothetical protein
MHPSLDELLALRDGGAMSAAAHVAGCDACRSELARLQQLRDRLRALPPAAPPADAWQRIRAARAAARSRRRWHYGGGLAMAASVLLALAVALRPALDVPAPAPAPQGELTDLHAHSQGLDALLGQFDTQHRVLDLRTAGTIVALEDRIAALDQRLAGSAGLEPPVANALLRQRVELMEALVGVHVAQAVPVHVDRSY